MANDNRGGFYCVSVREADNRQPSVPGGKSAKRFVNCFKFRSAPFLLSACFLGLAWRGFSFGHEGHEAVAVLALQKLHEDKAANDPKATAALEHVRTILGNEDLAAVAVWADWVRLEQTNHLSMSVIHDIKARFPGSDDWHFVDLPLGTTAYSDTAVSANVDDVVHGIGKCISMLESADRSAKKDRHAVALKFLVHLAGDIHQPLHQNEEKQQLLKASWRLAEMLENINWHN